MSEAKTPVQQKLYDRIGSKLKAPSSFSFALHGYDSVQIAAAADELSDDECDDMAAAKTAAITKPVRPVGRCVTRVGVMIVSGRSSGTGSRVVGSGHQSVRSGRCGSCRAYCERSNDGMGQWGNGENG